MAEVECEIIDALVERHTQALCKAEELHRPPLTLKTRHFLEEKQRKRFKAKKVKRTQAATSYDALMRSDKAAQDFDYPGYVAQSSREELSAEYLKQVKELAPEKFWKEERRKERAVLSILTKEYESQRKAMQKWQKNPEHGPRPRTPIKPEVQPAHERLFSSITEKQAIVVSKYNEKNAIVKSRRDSERHMIETRHQETLLTATVACNTALIRRHLENEALLQLKNSRFDQIANRVTERRFEADQASQRRKLAHAATIQARQLRRRDLKNILAQEAADCRRKQDANLRARFRPRTTPLYSPRSFTSTLPNDTALQDRKHRARLLTEWRAAVKADNQRTQKIRHNRLEAYAKYTRHHQMADDSSFEDIQNKYILDGSYLFSAPDEEQTEKNVMHDPDNSPDDSHSAFQISCPPLSNPIFAIPSDVPSVQENTTLPAAMLAAKRIYSRRRRFPSRSSGER